MLYEAAVQHPAAAAKFLAKIYRDKREKKAFMMREDFCGTAALCAEWVVRNKENLAWGVDLDQSTLEWGQIHNINSLKKEQQERIHFVQGDVCSAPTPPVDIINAFNFSYCCFKTRDKLRSYFQEAHRNLAKDGVLVVDLFGGTEAIMETTEARDVAEEIHRDGTVIPEFEYTWRHTHYNVINHHIECAIDFKVGKKKIKNAFTYDWRLWSLPEVKEIMIEAGFESVDIFMHGWTKDGECDDRFIKRTYFENAEGWLAYIAGWK